MNDSVHNDQFLSCEDKKSRNVDVSCDSSVMLLYSFAYFPFMY